VTFGASKRILEHAQTPEQLLALDLKFIEDLIFPAGFYRRKAEQLQTISKILVTKYGSQVPSTLFNLTKLPGVGLKTANLVLGIGFNQPAICVDIHVHRIANRIGAITSKTPDESLPMLMDAIPKTHWIQTNQVLVPFGQTVCTPRRPRCSSCPIYRNCQQISVSNPR
jgi:endonuclease-3